MRTFNNLKQGSPEWMAFRSDKVSGSVFSAVLSDKKEVRLGLIKELIVAKYANVIDDGYKSPQMVRGTEEEKFAAQEYRERFGESLEIVDICQHDQFDWLVFSPDRYADNRETYIEIKCPDSTTMVQYMIDNKIPSKYMPQLVLSFIVNEKQKRAKLVIYDGRFKEFNHQMLVLEVTREDLKDDIAEALKKMELFRKEWLEVDAYYQDLIF